MKLYTHALTLTMAVLLLLGTLSPVSAEPWAVVADMEAELYTLDLGTNPPTVYGPLLQGELGTAGGGLLDVQVVTQGNDFALVSNFGDSKVFRVDLADPVNPAVTAEFDTNMFAEDITVAPDASWAVVTDGGFSTGMDFINLSDNTVSTYTLTVDPVTTDPRYAQAVAIAPDGRTVIVADYFAAQVIYGPVNADHTGLESETAVVFPLTGDPPSPNSRPLNVAVSPDGRTVLVPTTNKDVQVLSLTDGVLTLAGCVADLPGSAQTIAFSPDGTRAYLRTSSSDPMADPAPVDQVAWLRINGPGDVSLGGTGVADLPIATSSQYFGIETLAISPDGTQLLASNPSSTTSNNQLLLLDTNDFSSSLVTLTDVALTTGVGIFYPNRLTVSITGSGRVISSPAGIDCGGGCSHEFATGSQVTLTAVPESGSAFEGWTGVTGMGSGPAVLTISGDQTVTAAFGPDADTDGVSDAVEDAGPNSGDGNRDGVLDSQQDNVATFQDAAGGWATLVSEDGTSLGSVSSSSIPDQDNLPENLSCPAGKFGFTLDGLTRGASTQVVLTLHNFQSKLNAYYKYGPTPDNAANHWYDFRLANGVGAEIDQRPGVTTITLNLTDGARGDADLTADGRIVDPGAPALRTGGGGGGGGCFINALFD